MSDDLTLHRRVFQTDDAAQDLRPSEHICTERRQRISESEKDVFVRTLTTMFIAVI